MDFIKTSSLRALIELTFQCKWNGLIWMSRKGVIAKRVKTAPDGHIENQRPNAQSGWPRNECSALGQTYSVRLKSRPKFQPLGRSHITTRETSPAVGQATPQPRTTSARAGRTPRGRATLTYRPTSVRAGNYAHVRPKTIGQIYPPTTAGRPKSSGHDRSDSAKTRLSGRSSRPTVRTPRSTRSRF
ncbi:unnamed protein product [Microthlaspi erraticum]|uniref:Uncharacterized protein n=1 Tax=Microthlaspi erraticum TaxID=1685480 RepID=A0A6D2LID5_9BRAS|nr:unnamed protein product [Microthlaspi erraticum]